VASAAGCAWPLGGAASRDDVPAIVGIFETGYPGDMVVDSFGGSGTTGAVAHKMRRRWIMVELGEHALTHCVPRLKKVISGEDNGGVTEAVGWQGGEAFSSIGLLDRCLRRTALAIGWSRENTMPPCWPKRCAS
jgi:hypothetical protein